MYIKRKTTFNCNRIYYLDINTYRRHKDTPVFFNLQQWNVVCTTKRTTTHL